MGWIKRHWFWYTHHSLYIESTEEQKAVARRKSKMSRQQLGMVMASAMVLSEQIK